MGTPSPSVATRFAFSGIDTPEQNQTCRRAGITWRCGYQATETLRNWTYTKEVRCIGDTKDRYGRLIANCFVDGYNVNARLVYEGLALAYRKYSKQYVPEEDKARAAKRGCGQGVCRSLGLAQRQRLTSRSKTSSLDEALKAVERANELLDDVERMREEWERSREIIESCQADAYCRRWVYLHSRRSQQSLG